MASRTQHVNGVLVNGDGPPPSTLAAQLVQNQTRAQATTQINNDGRSSFGQLLQLILRQPAAYAESDVNINVKLIGVVAEALGLVSDGNPFTQWDVVLPQAIDGMAVIQTTVQRQPETLFTPIDADGPRLLLPLFARLAAVCGRPRCQDIPVCALLASIFRGLEARIEMWPWALTLRSVVEASVEDLFSALESASSASSAISVKLPPARSIHDVWPRSRELVALPQNCQTTVDDRTHAFLLILNLSAVYGVSESWQSETQQRLQRLAESHRLLLQNAKQWEVAVRALLAAKNTTLLLATLLRQVESGAASEGIQTSMGQALVKMLQSAPNALYDHVLPCLFSASSSGKFDRFHEDLRIAVTTVMVRLCGTTGLPEPVVSLYDTIQRGELMTDSHMLVESRHFTAGDPGHAESCRRYKRRRVHDRDVTSPEDSRDKSVQSATKLLTGTESQELTGIEESVSDHYPGLSLEDKCSSWQSLTDLAAFEPTITATIVSRLLDVPDVQKLKRPRVLSMLAIQACVNRTSDPTYVDIHSSKFGQACLRSIHSSLRELRLAAGQCLRAFLRDDLPSELRDRNRNVTIEYLRALTERRVASEQESLVNTWGQIAGICSDAELNLALLRLVDYLGDPNSLIAALAFLELEKLEQTKGQPLHQVFRPFWNSIALSVVQDLHSRPQKAQQLCELLSTTLNQFLVTHQHEIVPTLVLTKNKTVLQRIAAARGKDTTVQDLCLQPKTNMAATLALLLSQPGPDAEDDAVTCLAEVASGFRGTDISSLIKLDPTMIACDMLKLMADQKEDRKSRAYHAFHQFANVAERRPGQGKAHAKSSRAVTEFFETHILGMLTHFSSVLDEPQTPATEKIRCLKAMHEMIHLNKGHIAMALPQIRASLESAMQQKQLCETAFSAWLDLLSVLQAEDLPTIIEQSFVLILRHWSDLSPRMQQKIHGRLEQLIKTHNTLFQDMVMLIPSLSGIPLLSKFADDLNKWKAQEGIESHLKAFSRRLRDENFVVVLRALEELVPYLSTHQDFVHDVATSEQPPTVLKELLRALLDATSKHASATGEAAILCGKALGTIGCLDPNRVEAPRKQRRLLVLSNFENADEVVQWTMAFLEDVLVKAFKSATSARAQGFLAYTMQELLRFCDFNDGTVLRPRASQVVTKQQRWLQLPEHVQITLTPFVTSRYLITNTQTQMNKPNRAYPDFHPEQGYSHWLRGLVFDLMWKAKGDNPQMVFPLLARIIRGHDISIASFILPYALLNVVVGGTVSEMTGITEEILSVLRCQPNTPAEQETVRLCCEIVFSVLDYMSTWLHEKKKVLGDTRAQAYRTGHSPHDFDEAKDMGQVDSVEQFMKAIPAEVVAAQAVTCGSYARALFNWERYIRQQRSLIPSATTFVRGSNDEVMYERLQEIYAEIDEPDGLEGISAHLPFINEDKVAMQHAKAGRWHAAQAWYEVQVAENPQNAYLEDKLLACLRETGRHAPLLRSANSFLASYESRADAEEAEKRLLPVVAEAYWMTGDLEGMKSRVSDKLTPHDFGTGLANIIGTISSRNAAEEVTPMIRSLRESVVTSMTFARTTSVQSCHEDMKKLHILNEVETLVEADRPTIDGLMAATLEKRLAVVGSYVSDQQYILGARRAIMQPLTETVNPVYVGSSWLASAKLARKMGHSENAYHAVLKAYDWGDKGAKLEEARLLWRDGHQRYAIQLLESAILSGAFEVSESDGTPAESNRVITRSGDAMHPQNLTAARAHLLLAKWLDASGQSQTKDMTAKYQYAAYYFKRWEKGHYYLGKHYQKLLEAEKALPKAKQSTALHNGELQKLVIDNLLRSVPFGNKYWHETIPKILTLWLDLGTQCLNRQGREDQSIFDKRKVALKSCTKQLQKYFERVPPYVFYSALPQMLSRITHTNTEIWATLSWFLCKLGSTHPSQALWGILAVTKATDRARQARGQEVLNRLKDPEAKSRYDGTGDDLRKMILQGQKLSDGLLQACEASVEARVSNVSLQKDLHFNHKLAPSALVVPIESTLTPSRPINGDSLTIRKHRAFVQDKITIQSFYDNVLVLSSLQRPKKITVRGSDGKQYGLLCKPKDDLRKDQRLMEFNGIINRALKRDAESSKRRLYIKTYAVTPLSEESGTIEWVEGIKPIRDILLNAYARKGIRPAYQDLRNVLNEACASPEKAHLFNDKVLPQFPAILHEWFVEVYPEPEAWFAARLRYARSAAVMSITGHVLGLGDRHGENILLEESTGGVFHVDFNCLFDKGLTFEKPELVPFRLTHNMVDAMGPYGYEGPFRKSSELTLRLLRQSKDTLMTVLETFVYDPTTDFVGKKKRTTAGVPETPQEILDSVDGKLKGLLKNETVPLSVEGYVDALIRDAVSPFCLASMYIGWCSFL